MKKTSLSFYFIVAFVFIQGCASVEGIKEEQKGPALQSQKLGDLSSALDETSGLALFANHFWVINDSGNSAEVHALDEKSLAIKKAITLKNAQNTDWEDLTQDDKYLYVLDTGNNGGTRSKFQIYRALLSDLAAAPDKTTLNSQMIEFQYGDKNGKVDSNSDEIDCEALTSVGDELWLFTKGVGNQDSKTAFYKLNKKQKHQIATPISEFNVGGLVTAADYNPRTGKLALLGYTESAFGDSFVWLIPVKDGAPQWNLARYHAILPHSQWEAIIWNPQNTLVIASEDSPIGNPILAELTKAKSSTPKK